MIVVRLNVSFNICIWTAKSLSKCTSLEDAELEMAKEIGKVLECYPKDSPEVCLECVKNVLYPWLLILPKGAFFKLFFISGGVRWTRWSSSAMPSNGTGFGLSASCTILYEGPTPWKKWKRGTVWIDALGFIIQCLKGFPSTGRIRYIFDTLVNWIN
jgi:hypothetical protein